MSRNKIDEIRSNSLKEYDSIRNLNVLEEKEVFRFILKIFFKNMDSIIFKVDKDGNIQYNENGEEIINWFGILKVIIFKASELIGNYLAFKDILKQKKLV